jgi:hypothetical protein
VITVCPFLWWDPQGVRNDVYVYGPEHVHRLRTMVERNLTVPHEFVCVSDRPIEGIKTIPLDRSKFIHGTRFAKLMLYRPDGPLAGRRVLYLDLDCIVTGELDSLVQRDEDLVLWRNPNFGQPGRARYNTSIILHTCGSRPEFWCEFDRNWWDLGSVEATQRNVNMTTGYGGTDQAWISHRASPEEAHWTALHGVYGAGRLGDAAQGAGTDLPPDARIVFTPGRRTPWTPGFSDRHPWVKDYAA